ncbi:MAG: hypothetical protein ACR2NU_06645 [Aeoliella sp.]
MMSKQWMLVLVVYCLTYTLMANCAAHEEDTEHRWLPIVDVSASGFWIGADGERHAFGSEDAGEGLIDLPEALRQQIEKMMQEGQDGGDGTEVKVQTFGKMIFIGPDGKKTVTLFGDDKQQDAAKMREKVLNSLPKGVSDEVRSAIKKATDAENILRQVNNDMGGKVIVIGPDGTKKEFNLGENGMLLKQLRMFGGKPMAKTKPETDTPNELILKKLDYLIRRIEKLEARIDELGEEE